MSASATHSNAMSLNVADEVAPTATPRLEMADEATWVGARVVVFLLASVGALVEREKVRCDCGLVEVWAASPWPGRA